MRLMKKLFSPPQRHDESGFAIYLVIGFIVLITFNLTSMGTRITQQNRMQFSAVKADRTSLAAHQAMQFGLIELRLAASDIVADENGYVLAAGTTDSDMTSDRDACLSGRSTITSLNASEFISSSPMVSDKIRNRYFLHDASAGTTPRNFDIFGCAVQDKQARLIHGRWSFDVATETFSLVRIISY